MIIENKSWVNVHESVIGKSHIKHELPNQDAVATKIIAEKTMVSAVADGHGSKKCFRSELGAKFAVDSAVEVAEVIQMEWLTDDGDLNIKKIGRYYTRKLLKKWKSKVENHLIENILEDEILEHLSEKERQSIDKNPLIVYGSTLIIVIIIDEYIVCYQLGDGDILFVSKSKKISRPLKKDQRHMGNDTLSLCLNKAEKEFKIRVFRDLKHLLGMIVLSTDGYSNSFSNELEFQKVGVDLMNLVEEEGLVCLDENLKTWLEETTELGSGDDISVSMLSRKTQEKL